MKITLTPNYRTGTNKHRPPPARLTGSRRPQSSRGRRGATVIEPVEPQVSGEPVSGEVFYNEPTETGDTLQLYLREIGQIKRITPAEEIVLARRIQRGDKKAREQMITANLRLVVKIARDYAGLGMPLLDLINEGNIGLMKGVQRFNPNKGAKLSTYAAWWIKQSIKRALSNQSKTIRLPVHVGDKMTRVRRAEVKLREVLDREPTDEEVAEEMGLNARRIRLYRDASRAPVALDSPISSEDSTTVSEHVADANAAAPFDDLVKNNDQDLVQEVLATLDARESRILSMRFGLDNGRPLTLEQVGERLGVTRERIRQIQEQALQKMRVKIEKRDEPSVALVA